MKMIMASAKATLISLASSFGLNFDRTSEIHAPHELDEYIKSIIQPIQSVSSSAAAAISHIKPQKPGRSKPSRPIAKFTPDSDI